MKKVGILFVAVVLVMGLFVSPMVGATNTLQPSGSTTVLSVTIPLDTSNNIGIGPDLICVISPVPGTGGYICWTWD